MLITPEAFSGIKYVYDHHPAVVPTVADARRIGANCETVAHFVLGNRGVSLPPDLRAAEMFESNEFSETVVYPPGPPIAGDIFFFGREKVTDPRRFHLAVHTGQFRTPDDPELLHANFQDNGVTVWSLKEFLGTSRYADLKGVKRFSSPNGLHESGGAAV